MEKRKNRRHAKRLRVRFGEADFTQQGFSSDVSATGMFVQTLSIPKLGTRLQPEEIMGPDARVVLFAGNLSHRKVDRREVPGEAGKRRPTGVMSGLLMIFFKKILRISPKLLIHLTQGCLFGQATVDENSHWFQVNRGIGINQ